MDLIDNDQQIAPEHHPGHIFEGYEDPLIHLTPSEILDAIKPMDGANDIIGIITVVNYPQKVKDKFGKEYLLFKFSMKCGNEVEVSVTAWDEEIPRIKCFIKPNRIIHLDGLFARSQDPKYSTDGRDYIFTIRSNTRLNVLGIKKEDENLDDEPVTECSNLLECLDLTTNISLTAYVKSNGFQPDLTDASKRIGLITDMKYKMNLVIFKYDDPTKIIEQGQKIKVKGRMSNSSVSPTFNVECLGGLEIIEGEKESVDKLRKINKFPKSSPLEDETCKQPKMAKKE